jgi:hypothetical protein
LVKVRKLKNQNHVGHTTIAAILFDMECLLLQQQC